MVAVGSLSSPHIARLVASSSCFDLLQAATLGVTFFDDRKWASQERIKEEEAIAAKRVELETKVRTHVKKCVAAPPAAKRTQCMSSVVSVAFADALLCRTVTHAPALACRGRFVNAVCVTVAWRLRCGLRTRCGLRPSETV
jgi:hypothetical protein